MPDEKALQILFEAHWTPKGWKEDRSVSPQDFEHAKRAGVMFDPATIAHDEIMNRLFAALKKVRLQEAAAGFVASLSTRRLDLRSALGSYLVMRHLPRHKFQPEDRRRTCLVCGVLDKEENLDLNVLNFERFKWGGVRHDAPYYAMFDLEQFVASGPAQPSEKDREILRAILNKAESVKASDTPQKLQVLLKSVFPSNKDERDKVMDILGFAGILAPKEHEGFLSRFIPPDQRELPSYRFVDRSYPLCWWRGRDGVNWEAARRVFGALIWHRRTGS
jgi:hypothetical protein